MFCLAVWLGAGCRPRPEVSARDVANYAPRITFSNFKVGLSENMAGQKIYYIDGVVRNGGDRTITALGVAARFRDLDRQVVLRDVATIVHARRTPLGPGESRSFRIGFEGVPDSWNHAAPDLEITHLALE